jgi:hypothetical protein
MTTEHTHEEEDALEAHVLSPKALQEEMAKRGGYMAGSLTFVLFIFPEFLGGLPHPDFVGLALLGAGVMYVLGYFVGHIWYAPRPKARKKPKKAQKSTASPPANPLPQELPALEKGVPATTPPVAEANPARQAVNATAPVEDM